MENFTDATIAFIPQEYGTDPSLFHYYNSLLKHRTVLLNMEIEDTITEYVIMPLLNFEHDDSDEPVTLIINTIGGDPSCGGPLLDIIDNYSKRLNIIILRAYSMGAFIAAAGTNNPNVYKTCYKNSTLLWHNGNITIPGAETGTAEDVIAFSKEIDSNLKDFMVSNSSLTNKIYDSFNRKQIYITGKKMLNWGIVDEMVGSEKLPDMCKKCKKLYNCEKMHSLAAQHYQDETAVLECDKVQN